MLGFLGLLCFLYTYNFNLPEYINFTLNTSRAERLSTISTAKCFALLNIFYTLHHYIFNYDKKFWFTKIFTDLFCSNYYHY